MRWMLAAAFAGATLAIGVTAQAQQTRPDPAGLCSTWRTQWNDVSIDDDAGAMRTFLARVPPACRQLRGQIERFIRARTPTPQNDVYPPLERVEPETPRRVQAPPDPCVAARREWAALERNGTLEQVRAFVMGAPTACGTERSAAQGRLAVLEDAARQATFEARYGDTLRYMGPDRAWFLAQNEQARAYFVPHTLQITLRSEQTTTYGQLEQPRAPGCSFELLPPDARRNATVTSTIETLVRHEPLLFERAQTGSRLRCSSERAETFRGDYRTTSVLNPHSHLLQGDYSRPGLPAVTTASAIGADPRRRPMIPITWTRNDLRPGSVTCVERNRMGPRAWRADFDYTLVEMSCSGSDDVITELSGSIWIVAELLMRAPFAGPSEYRMRTRNTGETTRRDAPSSVSFSRNADGFRVTFNSERIMTSAMRREATSTRTISREEWLITLTPPSPPPPARATP